MAVYRQCDAPSATGGRHFPGLLRRSGGTAPGLPGKEAVDVEANGSYEKAVRRLASRRRLAGWPQ
jgi:hypothetical protein